MKPEEVVIHFLPLAVATKLFVSLGCGLLVGFEREWSRKDIGARSFAIVSLMGMLSSLDSDGMAMMAMGAVIVLAAVMNAGSLWLHRELETTTSAALVATFVMGVLVGKGHIFTPVASAILMTLLLAMKAEFTRLAGGVTAEEVRGAVLLGLIGFVIYPLLPDRTLDPWNLFNPREAWLTVMLIAGISFINYWLLRLYSTRGLYYTAIFGGLVNSTATIAELSSSIASTGAWPARLGMSLTVLTTISMFVRNLVVLVAFSRPAAAIAFWPILAMSICAAIFTLRKTERAQIPVQVKLSSPISIRKIASFSFLFLAIQVLGALGQRFFGDSGVVVVSFVGGLVSSASATAAVGSLNFHQQISAGVAAIAVVLTSVASALVNIPIIYREARDRSAVWLLIVVSGLITVVGLGVLALVMWLGLPYLPR